MNARLVGSEAPMPHSRRPEGQHSRRACVAALALIACIGWSVRTAARPPSGFGVGWISALVIDPQTPTTLYAATECSGVFKSLDGSETLQHAGTGLPQGPVNALVIDPLTPATLYSGTEEGVYKSTDGGDTWSPAGLSGQLQVRALALDPTTATTVYAGGRSLDPEGPHGLYMSEDGGRTWAPTGLNVAPVLAIAIDPATPATVYAATSAAGAFKSTDGGDTWAKTGLTDISVFTLAIAPTAPPTLYAVAGSAPDANPGLYKSTNGGNSWVQVDVGVVQVLSAIWAIAIDPTAPDTVYLGGYFTFGRGAPPWGLLKSATGGRTWTRQLSEVGVLALAIDPATPSTLYAATDWQTIIKIADGPERGGVIFHWDCGDGILACEEQCDDGNLTDGDGCDSNCTITACGNGILNAGEECDDGNLVDGDGCDSTCTPTACGNAVVSPGEQCDDGNLIDGDGCDSNCIPTACGNGILTAGEQCDDGNRNPFDGCTASCTICGDGNITAPEQCDDGNNNPTDGCTAACTSCGNGVVTAPEGCDDGNLVNGDGCENYCAAPGCGNAVVEDDEGCDDGGVCVSGADEGTYCSGSGQCSGGECRPAGGDGCAVNCTAESIHVLPLDAQVPEFIHQFLVVSERTWLSGSLNLHLGGPAAVAGSGEIPVTVRAADVTIAPIGQPGRWCLCVRGAGPATGVAGAGSISCTGPMSGIDVMSSIDRSIGDEAVSFSGNGPPGSARLDLRLESWSLRDDGFCESAFWSSMGVYGADGIPCTDDDPRSDGMLPPQFILRLTTGLAAAEVLNANGATDHHIADGAQCFHEPCTTQARGMPLDCAALEDGTFGLTLAGALPWIDNFNFGVDSVTTFLLGPGLSDVCLGDCNGDGLCQVNELILAVRISLGEADVGQCDRVDYNDDGVVTISELIGGVRNGLCGCGQGGGGSASPEGGGAANICSGR